MSLKAFTQPVSESFSQKFRSQVGHISKHSGTHFAGTIVTIVLGYLFKVYLARVLGAEALGIYALGMTLVGFLGAFNSLGLVESAVRFAAVYRAARNWNELRALLWRGGAILLCVNAGFASLVLVFGGSAARGLYHSTALARYIPWFALLMLIGAVSTFYNRVLAGYGQVGRRTIITNFIGIPCTMLFSIVLIGMGYGLRGYLSAQVCSSALVLTLMLILIWRLTPPEARRMSALPARLAPEVWSFSGVAMGVLLLEFVIGQVDKVTLGYFRGAKEVGIYSIAAAIVAYTSLFLNSVNQVFSPVIADLHTRKDMEMLGRLYRALTKWILALTIPLAIVVMVDARPVLAVFGHDFESGWPILLIGTTGQLINCAVGSVGLLLLMSGNQNRLLRVQASMAAVVTVTSLIMVPIWGAIGAAIAAAITNAGTNAWNLVQVRKVLGLSPFSRGYMRLAFPSAGCALGSIIWRYAGCWSRNSWLALGAGLFLSYFVFVALAFTGGLDQDDRTVGNALWSRLRGAVSRGIEA